MTTKTLSTLYTLRLNVNDAFSLIKSTCEIAEPVQDKMGDICRAAFVEMVKNNNLLGNSINKVMKSIFTEPLTELNKERNDLFSEIKRGVSYHEKGRDENKKSAAENLKNFLSPYWTLKSVAMNTETNVFSEMFTRYKESNAAMQAASIIGIDSYFSEFESVNARFDLLYKSRLQEEAEKNGPSGSDLKPAAVKSYETFCNTVELSVNLSGNDTIVGLFNNMDELRKKYSALIAKTKDKLDDTAKISSTGESDK